ncbi:helix-turn-helix transcriptional regulator [Paenibacillus dokdonensis]|uniref:Helix-turn-helix transcriptional regulator n=1 Tax=Paenibacillus dokdonensis TaxID=2567944 RepID=A0ABU6GWP3_9BACL|nr:helix-turn-helix transcriptional regulator [Paenibacillus dokdonensis]MEC0244161.1 helix-turn-helix transcriptional regulator [Paenibacillus dokdonensis]
MLDIRSEFGQRVRELRARSGMSQDILAYRSGLDRTCISGVERGERNISIVNIEKIAAGLQVTVSYMFSSERFKDTPAYQQKDFIVPFSERFEYKLDNEKKVLAFQVHGLLTPQNVDYMSKTLLGICNAFGKGELNILVDHREMSDSTGEIAIYSPEVAERAVAFQQELLVYSKNVVALCNSEFMVQQLNHVAQTSGIIEKATHLFDKDMLERAYSLLDINGNDLIKAKAN